MCMRNRHPLTPLHLTISPWRDPYVQYEKIRVVGLPCSVDRLLDKLTDEQTDGDWAIAYAVLCMRRVVKTEKRVSLRQVFIAWLNMNLQTRSGKQCRIVDRPARYLNVSGKSGTKDCTYGVLFRALMVISASQIWPKFELGIERVGLQALADISRSSLLL